MSRALLYINSNACSTRIYYYNMHITYFNIIIYVNGIRTHTLKNSHAWPGQIFEYGTGHRVILYFLQYLPTLLQWFSTTAGHDHN